MKLQIHHAYIYLLRALYLSCQQTTGFLFIHWFSNITLIHWVFLAKGWSIPRHQKTSAHRRTSQHSSHSKTVGSSCLQVSPVDTWKTRRMALTGLLTDTAVDNFTFSGDQSATRGVGQTWAEQSDKDRKQHGYWSGRPLNCTFWPCYDHTLQSDKSEVEAGCCISSCCFPVYWKQQQSIN